MFRFLKYYEVDPSVEYCNYKSKKVISAKRSSIQAAGDKKEKDTFYIVASEISPLCELLYSILDNVFAKKK